MKWAGNEPATVRAARIQMAARRKELAVPYVEATDQTRLYYQDWGSGRPVVFVSSWSLSCRMWQYHMVTLIDHGLRCIAYDRRGHGRSDQPGHGYEYDTLADDLATLVDTLRLDRLTLVGHSMAAGEIVRYLTRHSGARVAGIVLVSPLAPFPMRTSDNPHGFDPAVVAAVRGTWRKDFTAWMDASTGSYVGEGLPGCEVSAGLIEWTKQDMLQTSLLASIECNRAAVETDLRAEMTKIRVPALIIHGDHDASIPVELSGQVCADLIPGSGFLRYENAPHGLYLTHRDRLTDDLLQFLQSR